MTQPKVWSPLTPDLRLLTQERRFGDEGVPIDFWSGWRRQMMCRRLLAKFGAPLVLARHVGAFLRRGIDMWTVADWYVTTCVVFRGGRVWSRFSRRAPGAGEVEHQLFLRSDDV